MRFHQQLTVLLIQADILRIDNKHLLCPYMCFLMEIYIYLSEENFFILV